MFNKLTACIVLLAIIQFFGAVYGGKPCLIGALGPFDACAIDTIDETECTNVKTQFMEHFSCQESIMKRTCQYIFEGCDEKKLQDEAKSFCTDVKGTTFDPFSGTRIEGVCA